MSKIPYVSRVKFAYDVASGSLSLHQLAERYEISYGTVRRWRDADWCAWIVNYLHKAVHEDAARMLKQNAARAMQNVIAIANLATDIQRAMAICMERLDDPDATAVTFDFKGFPTVLEANRMLLEAIGLVGSSDAATSEVLDVRYQTRWTAEGGLRTTAIASGADDPFPPPPEQLDPPRDSGNGHEVG